MRTGTFQMGVLVACLVASAAAAQAEKPTTSSANRPMDATRIMPIPARLEIGSGMIEDQDTSLPDVPWQHYVVGVGVVEGGVAGATGTEVYRNTQPSTLHVPGANVMIADDMQIVATEGCNLSWLQLRLSGGGNGTGPGFSADFSVYNGCPNGGGTLIPGTQGHADLANNGPWLVSLDLESSPVPIPGEVWVRLSVSSAQAGWYAGRQAQLGFTAELFDRPANPCNATLSGSQTEGFWANIFCAGDVEYQFEGYRSDAPSGFFFGMMLTEQFADDILPITAPAGNCGLVGYAPVVACQGGTSTFFYEIMSHDNVTMAPMAPVLGTMKTCPCPAGGPGCAPTFFPPIEVPTPQMWLTYDRNGSAATTGGPVLAADFPSIGFSADGFSIFGDPVPGEWSPAEWWFGGCPMDETGNPCGTFHSTILCSGTPPKGACCDVNAIGAPCTDNVGVAECDGRWIEDALCAPDPFNPPCGTSACCRPDNSCANLTFQACSTAAGLWQPGQFCGEDTQTCPPGVCISATNACNVPNDNAPGCNDLDCCAIVCGIDSFCCEVAWDGSCVNLASSSCPMAPPNNGCAAAIAIGDGTFTFNTTNATTDGPPLPGLCDEGFGNAFGSDIWYNFTAPMTGDTTVTLCTGTPYDSRMSVYSGCGCPPTNTNLAACNDDACGEPPMVGGPSAMTFPVTAGNCYKLRIGGFGVETGMGTADVTTTGVPVDMCPVGAVTFTNPAGGTVDARQPHPVNSATPLQGIQMITATAPAGAETSCWSLCETASSGTPNGIQSVQANGTTYTITLTRPITAGAVTRITYTNDNNVATTGAFISHPGNVNGDGLSSPLDVLAVIDCLNNVNLPMNCPWGLASQDIDRSGAFGPGDILRSVDLLNGADAFIVWNNTQLPTNNGICP